MFRRSLMALPVVMMVFLIAVVAQNPSNMIRGKIRAANGAPVNGAIVELREAGGAILGQTVTRNDGDFAFTRVVPAEYEIHVTMSGFESNMQMVRFAQTDRMNFYEVVNVEILLRPKADTAMHPAGISFAQDVPPNARAAYEKGVAKLRDGKSEEGIALLREAVNFFQPYFDANFTLARELFRTGKDNEALEALERARQVNERESAVYQLFGLIMLKQRKFKVAEFAFREAVQFNPNNVAAHFYRGRVLIELVLRNQDEKARVVDLADAEKELNQAWDLSSKKLYEVYVQRARIHEYRGNKEAAAADLEAFLKAEPNAPNAAALRLAIENLRKP
ncbi:MAG: carboxypeptidase regulatory-like domain-containing protein [Acidobacteria bacterium]|nr:carboxypeptidase regulatory-like domain-containing protein [Acidobacteriota bacterium]